MIGLADFFFGGLGQVHQVHFYMRGILAVFSSTGNSIYVFSELMVIPGNIDSCFLELMLLY